jgi:hypothetical protein
VAIEIITILNVNITEKLKKTVMVKAWGETPVLKVV